MKTTLNLNDALLIRAKTLAAQQRTSLTRLIEEGLQLRLKAVSKSRARPRLTVYPGKGGLAACASLCRTQAAVKVGEIRLACRSRPTNGEPPCVSAKASQKKTIIAKAATAEAMRIQFQRRHLSRWSTHRAGMLCAVQASNCLFKGR